MEHDFDIKQGHNDITIMCCKKCGLSYRFVTYATTPTYAAWERIRFQDHTGEDIDPPGSCRFVVEKDN